jgi:hypothetical protein
MKRYIRANDNSALFNKLGITSQEFEVIKRWCDNYDPDSSVGFESGNGMWVTNPFLDESGRFELSLAEAVNTYGLDNIKNFCRQVLSQNQIFDIDDDGKFTTFFLYTEGDGYWYLTIDTPIVKEYPGTNDVFVNDIFGPEAEYGSSVAFFDTLEEAKEDFYSDFE